MKDTPYDYRNCQSLFGYAQEVHARSGATCELCGCGAGQDVDFDLWRQMTVEHLIGESQGGYLKAIRSTLLQRFPELPHDQLEPLALVLDSANTVTACSFCNSTTSRTQHEKSMSELLAEATGTPQEILAVASMHLVAILENKKRDVAWKLESVRRAFHDQVVPRLRDARSKRIQESPTLSLRSLCDQAISLAVRDMTEGVFDPASEGDIVGLVFHHSLRLAAGESGQRSTVHINPTQTDRSIPDLVFGDGEIIVEVKLSKAASGGYTQAAVTWAGDIAKLRKFKEASPAVHALFFAVDRSGYLSNPSSSNYFDPQVHGLRGEWRPLAARSKILIAELTLSNE